jgi:hypothetical protein
MKISPFNRRLSDNPVRVPDNVDLLCCRYSQLAKQVIFQIVLQFTANFVML